MERGGRPSRDLKWANMSLRGAQNQEFGLRAVKVMLISANNIFDVKEISERSYGPEYIDNFLALGMHLEGCSMIQFGGRYFC